MLRDQGLGKYCDPEFVRAASREMQEAMDMTPEEFDEAAHRLLQAEQVSVRQVYGKKEQLRLIMANGNPLILKLFNLKKRCIILKTT